MWNWHLIKQDSWHVLETRWYSLVKCLGQVLWNGAAHSLLSNWYTQQLICLDRSWVEVHLLLLSSMLVVPLWIPTLPPHCKWMDLGCSWGMQLWCALAVLLRVKWTTSQLQASRKKIEVGTVMSLIIWTIQLFEHPPFSVCIPSVRTPTLFQYPNNYTLRAPTGLPNVY